MEPSSTAAHGGLEMDVLRAEAEEKAESNTFRSLQQPGIKEGRGRCIPLILHHRALCGSRAVGGIRGDQQQQQQQQQQKEEERRLSEDQYDNDSATLNAGASPATVAAYGDDGDSAASSAALTEDCSDKIRTGTSCGTAQSMQKKRLKLNAFPCRISDELRNYAEYYAVTNFHWSYVHHRKSSSSSPIPTPLSRNNSSPATASVSTISVSFSPDGRTFASTHGDHTVKITCCHSGRLVRNLEGHPRTPWTVKYHPTRNNIVASGCLGCQVRLWDWDSRPYRTTQRLHQSHFSYEEGTGVCLNMIRLHFAIISLSFHPSGHLLAVASGSSLHLWDFDDYAAKHMDRRDNNNTDKLINGSTGERYQQVPASSLQEARGSLREIRYPHALRCVHFPPNGTSIIIGGVNQPLPPSHNGRNGMGGGGMSFSLQLMDFDLEAALDSRVYDLRYIGTLNTNGARKESMTNSRPLVKRALLYNDGGFDVSSDGKTLCACVEYWLPDGIDNAMDLLHDDYDDDTHDDDTHNDGEDDGATEENNDEDSDQTEAHVGTERKNSETEDAGLSNQDRRQTSSIESTESSVENVYAEADSGPSSFASPPRDRSGNTTPSVNVAAAAANVANLSDPKTPPNLSRPQMPLSPPSPPGRRAWVSGPHASYSGAAARVMRVGRGRASARTAFTGPSRRRAIDSNNNDRGTGANNVLPPPPHYPHALDFVGEDVFGATAGRYVPHVVTVSLDDSPPLVCSTSFKGRASRPELGQLLEAAPLDGARALGVTCVKFSPSAEFCLLGYGVRENADQEPPLYHPVAALYRIRGGMTHVSTMLSGEDDVNIARFHPESGHGFVYGTKQGRIRMLSPRPWNHYYQ